MSANYIDDEYVEFASVHSLERDPYEIGDMFAGYHALHTPEQPHIHILLYPLEWDDREAKDAPSHPKLVWLPRLDQILLEMEKIQAKTTDESNLAYKEKLMTMILQAMTRFKCSNPTLAAYKLLIELIG